MKSVTVYTIRQEVKALVGKYIELHSMSPVPLQTVYRNNSPLETKVTTHVMPIHRVVHPVKGEHFFACEPELLEIIEAPVRSELAREVSANSVKLDRMSQRVKILEDRQQSFLDKSRLQRLVAAWKGVL